jgi:NAD+ synthase
MTAHKAFSPNILNLDCDQEIGRIAESIRKALQSDLKRKGIVLGISGGIDSSTTAALCVQAVGKERVFGLLMPEQDSSEETEQYGKLLCRHLDINWTEEVITPMLTEFGCYRRRNQAIRQVVPEFGDDWKCKIVLPSVLEKGAAYRAFSIVVQSPDGKQISARLNHAAYLGIVAATNFKQRTRKVLEYYHADRLHYAVAGTPNRLEYDQGFFVKLGDGAADVKPIAHLYKSQVYRLAEHLGLPTEIVQRAPTTDTYSLPQSQEEFYFSLPYDKMDLCLYGRNNNYSPEEVAPVVGLTEQQVQWVYNDIDQKRKTTRYLQLAPLLVEPVTEERTVLWSPRKNADLAESMIE